VGQHFFHVPTNTITVDYHYEQVAPLLEQRSSCRAWWFAFGGATMHIQASCELTLRRRHHT